MPNGKLYRLVENNASWIFKLNFYPILDNSRKSIVKYIYRLSINLKNMCVNMVAMCCLNSIKGK